MKLVTNDIGTSHISENNDDDRLMANRLITVERDRTGGKPDISIEKFEANMRDAIKHGANLGR